MGSQSLPLHLLAPGVEVPPGRRHLDRKAVVPQVVGDLAVGVGAGVGPKRTPTRAIEASRRLQQADYRELTQIIEGMGSAAGKVAGDLLCQIQVGQRQGVGGGMGMHRALAPVLHPGSLGPGAVGEGKDQLLVALSGLVPARVRRRLGRRVRATT